MTVRWIFDDGTTQVTLPMNPAEMGSPWPTRPVTAMTTTMGVVLVTEGSPQPANWTFRGTVLTKAHHDLLLDWFLGAHSRRRIVITDHLGRDITVVPISIELIPQRSALHPWRHSFSATTLAISVGPAA